MELSREKFALLIERLESLAREQPSKYALRVFALAILGYTYIFFILLLLIACVALLAKSFINGKGHYVAYKIGLPLVILIYVILRSLWVKFAPCEGIRIRKEDAKELFAIVEGTRIALKAPPIHEILITDEFNAAIAQIPRLGILGWHKNSLILGMPLLQAITYEQFRAVLAHEMGHLSANHGRFSCWIYQVRSTWTQLLEQLHQDSALASLLFHWFVKWYVPFFDAYSFVLARIQECHADICAVEIAGAKAQASSLINTEVKGRYLDRKYWKEVFDKADTTLEPPTKVYAAMSESLQKNLSKEDAQKWLEESLQNKTDIADTHPCLSERLQTIQSVENNGDYLLYARQHLNNILEVKKSAAEELFGSQLTHFVAQVDSCWSTRTSPEWDQRFQYIRQGRKDLEELANKAEKETLSLEEERRLALATLRFKNSKLAVPLLEKFLSYNPDDAEVNFSLGEALLEQKNASGISYLEQAATVDPAKGYDACLLIHSYLKEQGRNQDAEQYRKRLDQHYDVLQEAATERAGISEKDEYIEHGLSETSLNELHTQLSNYQDISRAYLIRKMVTKLDHVPFFVLIIAPNHPWFRYISNNAEQKLLERLVQEVTYPGETYIITTSGLTSKIKKALKRIKNAEIFKH